MDKEERIRLYLSGMTVREIAPLAGVNYQTVLNTLTKAGVPRRGRGPRIKGQGYKHRHWIHDIKKRYGVTEEQYFAMEASQQGLCAICLKKCSARKRLGVDHCHTTKKVRGLLCVKCNNAVGLLNDDPEVALRMSEYLERNNAVR